MALMTIKEGDRSKNEKEKSHFWVDIPGNDLNTMAMHTFIHDTGFIIKTYNDVPMIFADPPKEESDPK